MYTMGPLSFHLSTHLQRQLSCPVHLSRCFLVSKHGQLKMGSQSYDIQIRRKSKCHSWRHFSYSVHKQNTLFHLNNNLLQNNQGELHVLMQRRYLSKDTNENVPPPSFTQDVNTPGTMLPQDLSAVLPQDVNALLSRDLLRDFQQKLSHAEQLKSMRTSEYSGFYYFFSPEFPPVKYAMTFLENFHEYTHLPWWATIFVTTFLIRATLTLPLQIRSMRVHQKVDQVGQEMVKMSHEVRKEIMELQRLYKWTDMHANMHYHSAMRDIRRRELKKRWVHPIQGFMTPIVQIPLWVTLSISYRHLTGLNMFSAHGGDKKAYFDTAMVDEGILWFPNLCTPDVTYLLPILYTGQVLVLAELSFFLAKTGMRNSFKKMKDGMPPDKVNTHHLEKMETSYKRKMFGVSALQNTIRVFSIYMFYVSSIVPSGMVWYWTCSVSFGVLQLFLLRSPTLLQKLGFNNRPDISATPHRDLLIGLKNYYLRRNPEIAKPEVEKMKNKIESKNK